MLDSLHEIAADDSLGEIIIALTDQQLNRAYSLAQTLHRIMGFPQQGPVWEWVQVLDHEMLVRLHDRWRNNWIKQLQNGGVDKC